MWNIAIKVLLALTLAHPLSLSLSPSLLSPFPLSLSGTLVGFMGQRPLGRNYSVNRVGEQIH